MASFTFVQDYLRHRLTANNRHGIHSPFVYQLIDTVIYDYSHPKDYQQMAAEIKDKKTALLLKPKVGQLLYRLARHFNPAIVVEMGKGRSTNPYLQKAVPGAGIINVDQDNLSNISKKPVDMVIFNDGAPSMPLFEVLLSGVHPNTVLIFAGVHKNQNNRQKWEQVKTHPRVTLTIDLFWISLVFFKTGRAEKEHFRIRYW